MIRSLARSDGRTARVCTHRPRSAHGAPQEATLRRHEAMKVTVTLLLSLSTVLAVPLPATDIKHNHLAGQPCHDANDATVRLLAKAAGASYASINSCHEVAKNGLCRQVRRPPPVYRTPFGRCPTATQEPDWCGLESLLCAARFGAQDVRGELRCLRRRGEDGARGRCKAPSFASLALARPQSLASYNEWYDLWVLLTPLTEGVSSACHP